MALIPRLELRQSQSLVMTPQLQQAIKLLQLSNIELIEYVDQELEQNPLLERGSDDYDVDGDTPDVRASASDHEESTGDGSPDISQTPGAAASDVDDNNQWDDDGPYEVANGSSTPEYGGNISDGAFGGGGARGGTFNDITTNLEDTLSVRISLREHLNSQLAMLGNAQADHMIAIHLIDMLDASGYIQADISHVAEALNCSIDMVEAVLSRLQQFDPPGIFARNLSECLALQLRDKDRLDPAMQALLDNLDLFAKRDMASLIKICGVDGEDISDMVAEVRELNPKPALAFEYTETQPVIPDVIMKAMPGGGWIIELNSETLPKVLVNNSYYAYVKSAARTREDKQYINECMQSASWLVKSLHQRATTILKVASEIALQQDGFFIHGVDHLKPLVLRDIAEEIEMHESTVSRVTSNKYIATPRGIYELKYFFTPAIASSCGGESHSAESVRHRLKLLIDNEPPEKILSDDKIVTILKQEGIDIARRTVAKYREAMGISSSVQRRREKASDF